MKSTHTQPKAIERIFDREEIRSYLYQIDPFVRSMLDDDQSLEIRIRIFNGSMEFLYGNPQFDSDHRGLWAYSSYSHDSSIEETIDQLWEDLIVSYGLKV